MTQPPSGGYDPNFLAKQAVRTIIYGMVICLVSLLVGVPISIVAIFYHGLPAIFLPVAGLGLGGIIALSGSRALSTIAKGPMLAPGPQWAQMQSPPAQSTLPGGQPGAAPYGQIANQPPSGPVCQKCLTTNESGAQICDECGSSLVGNLQ